MPVGMIAAIAAVLADSVVTIIVGYKLTHTARTEIAKGVQDVIAQAPELITKAMMGGNEDGSSES